MKTRALVRRLGLIMAALLFGILSMAMPASAADSIDTGRRCSLSVYFGEDGRAFSGVTFSVYRVASVSGSGTFTAVGDFAGYPVRFDNLTSSGWRALAQTLSGYAASDGITPDRTAATGSSGWVTFSRLPTGLYLVQGDSYELDGTVYTPEPMLLSLPGEGTDGNWDYSVEAYCKYDWEDEPDRVVQYTVRKIWKDTGYKEDRPSSVRVLLLENGRVADSVVLSEWNNWKYTWRNLSASSRWQVVEVEVPDEYTVSVSREGTTFYLTNTHLPEEEPPPPPTDDNPPPPSTDDEPPDNPTEEPVEPPSYPSENPTSPPKLPQTGLLWWPVPVLIYGGLLLMMAGLALRRNQGDKDEK